MPQQQQQAKKPPRNGAPYTLTHLLRDARQEVSQTSSSNSSTAGRLPPQTQQNPRSGKRLPALPVDQATKGAPQPASQHQASASPVQRGSSSTTTQPTLAVAKPSPDAKQVVKPVKAPTPAADGETRRQDSHAAAGSPPDGRTSPPSPHSTVPGDGTDGAQSGSFDIVVEPGSTATGPPPAGTAAVTTAVAKAAAGRVEDTVEGHLAALCRLLNAPEHPGDTSESSSAPPPAAPPTGGLLSFAQMPPPAAAPQQLSQHELDLLRRVMMSTLPAGSLSPSNSSMTNLPGAGGGGAAGMQSLGSMRRGSVMPALGGAASGGAKSSAKFGSRADDSRSMSEDVNVSTEKTAPFVSRTAMRSFRVTEDDVSVVTPQVINAALLFVDLSGYSKVTAAIAHKGAYALNKVVNAVFSVLVDVCVLKFGGDVVKFAGDAMIAVWPESEMVEIEEAVQRAAECALYLHEHHPCFPVEGTEHVFRHHIGLSYGELTSTVMQGTGLRHTQHNWHYLTGEPVQNAGECVEYASSDEIVACGDAAKILGSKFSLGGLTKPLESGDTQPMFRVLSGPSEYLHEPMPPSAAQQHRSGDETPQHDDHHEFEMDLPIDYDLVHEARNQQEFIHLHICHRLAADIPVTNMAEMRLLGVFFIRLTDTLTTVDDWFVELLSILDANRCGTVQIIDDDKGVHVVAAANLHVAVAEPASAIADVCQELLDRRMGATVGAAVGVVFCGVVGNKRACRWDITGEACVRACRLMQHGLATGNPVVLDSSVNDNLTDHSRIELLDPDVTVKGSADPVRTFRLSRTTTAAISVMPPPAPFDDPTVHAGPRKTLSVVFGNPTVQRAVAVIAGPTGSGKSFLCRRTLTQAARATILSHRCAADGPRLQIARTLATWFAEHPYGTIRQRAEELRDALDRGHALRSHRACLDLVRATIYRGARTGIVISAAQLLDVDSLKLINHVMSTAPTPGGGRFMVCLCLMPQLKALTMGAIRGRLMSVPHKNLVAMQLSRLTGSEVHSLIETRLGWTCGAPLRSVIKALSMNLPVCVDKTIAMIQAQRPYITQLTTDGVVNGDESGLARISRMSWTKISPQLCARIQHLYDGLRPRMQALLRIVAVLQNPYHAVPCRLVVAVAMKMLKRSTVASLFDDLISLCKLMLLESSPSSRAGDVFTGTGSVFLASAFNTYVPASQQRSTSPALTSSEAPEAAGDGVMLLTPQFGEASGSIPVTPYAVEPPNDDSRPTFESSAPVTPQRQQTPRTKQSAMEKLCDRCVIFQIPALRDVVKQLTVPAERSQIVHRAVKEVLSGTVSFSYEAEKLGRVTPVNPASDLRDEPGVASSDHPAVRAVLFKWLASDRETDNYRTAAEQAALAATLIPPLMQSVADGFAEYEKGGKLVVPETGPRLAAFDEIIVRTLRTLAPAKRLLDHVLAQIDCICLNVQELSAEGAEAVAKAKATVKATIEQFDNFDEANPECTAECAKRFLTVVKAPEERDEIASILGFPLSDTTAKEPEATAGGATPCAVPATQRMSMDVVKAKNLRPPVALGPITGHLMDLGWALKDAAIVAGTCCADGGQRGRPLPPELAQTIRSRAAYVVAALEQVDELIALWGTSAEQASAAVAASGMRRIVGAAASELSPEQRKRRSPSGDKQSKLTCDISGGLGRLLVSIADPDVLGSSPDVARSACAAFLEWVDDQVVPRAKAAVDAMAGETDAPPDPSDPVVADRHQRDMLQRAFDAVQSSDGLGASAGSAVAAVQRGGSDATAAADMKAVQRGLLQLATMGHHGVHPRLTASFLRDTFVYDRTAGRRELATFLFLSLALSSPSGNGAGQNSA